MTPDQKETVWNFGIAQKPWPNGVTTKRLEKVKPIIMRWDGFWRDMEAHRLNQVTPEQLKLENPETFEHAFGNFWGLVYEALYKSGIIK